MEQSDNDRVVYKLSIAFTQPVSLLQEICLFASFWFCLFCYAWSVQLKDKTLGKSVYFNTANFHSMANFTFVSKCFSLPNYAISLPATQPFSQSAVREESKKKKHCIQEMSMSESIWIFQHVSSKSKDLDSSSTAVKRLHC